MIFRTIADQSNGAVKSIGLFGKTINELRSSFNNIKKNGFLNSIFKTSTIDNKAINDYNKIITEAIKNNLSMADKQQIIQTAMEGTNKETAKLINCTKGLIVTDEALSKAQNATTLSAKAATTATKALSIACNMIAMLAISALVSKIQEWADAKEEARKKAVELTNTYKEEQASLDSQIKKYTELKETLDNGNLSIDEALSIKEQLLEIQNSLVESYGKEASNINLVNGKYREQLGLLNDLSKEQANKYVTEHRDDFKEAKEALEEIREFNLGTVTGWSSYAPKTKDQDNLLDFIKTYSDLLELNPLSGKSGNIYGTTITLSVKANTEDADKLMYQFSKDLEQFGKDNNIDVSGLLENISSQLENTWTDELTEYKTIYDEFLKAEVIRSDTLRPLYEQSIQAVEDYNNALASGEGVEKARKNLNSVQHAVRKATVEVEGTQEVFNNIYNSISKNAEAAYNLGKMFESSLSVKSYAEKLRGLSTTDLILIDFDDNEIQNGEMAMLELMKVAGITEDNIQTLIDKLVEFGYVQGKVQDLSEDSLLSLSDWLSASSSSGKTYAEEIDDWENQIKELQSLLIKINSGEQDISVAEVVVQFPDIQPYIDQYDNLSAAINAFMRDSYTKLINSFGDTSSIENFSYELEYLQLVLNKGLGGSNNIKKLKSSYEELIDVLDRVHNNQDFSSDEIAALINKYGDLKEAVIITTDGYQLEEDTLINLINNYIALSNTAISNQIALTKATIENIKTRINAWGLELDVMRQIAGIYNATNSKNVVAGFLNDNYGSGITSATPAIIQAALDYVKANDELSKLLKQLDDSIYNKNNNGLSSNSSTSASSSSAAEQAAETFDWIETAVTRLEEAVSRLNDGVSNTYTTWTKRNSALTSEISKVKEEIALQEKAYNAYMAKANAF